MKLTPDELNTLANAEFFRLRQNTEDKISELFGQLKQNLQPSVDSLRHCLPEGCESPGKISRGERHHGFPWRALDYPAIFTAKDIFAFRSLVVWGYHFSFHLILGGESLEKHGPSLSSNAGELETAGFRKAIQETPWEWLEEHHSSLLTQSDKDGVFLKISAFLPLSEYERVPDEGLRVWQTLSGVLFP